MRSKEFIIILVVIFIAWGSNFLTTINQSSKINNLIAQDSSSTQAALNHHTSTLNTINTGFANLNTKVDCIFTYFATPGRNGDTTLTISPNQKECNIDINPSSSGGATGNNKSG